jgi:hypothetical protein
VGAGVKAAPNRCSCVIRSLEIYLAFCTLAEKKFAIYLPKFSEHAVFALATRPWPKYNPEVVTESTLVGFSEAITRKTFVF